MKRFFLLFVLLLTLPFTGQAQQRLSDKELENIVWVMGQMYPDGFTLSLDSLRQPARGIAVAYAATQNSFDRKSLKRVVKHARAHDNVIGGWLDYASGHYYFDSSRIFPEDSLQAALAFARENDQLAVFDLGNGIVIPTDTTLLSHAGQTALLMVHFGTTYDETREKTIEAINRKAAEAFPEMTLREAYTSRIVIRRLKGRGIEKQTPLEALEQLRSEGYAHVIVQSTTLLEGAEMESLRRDVASIAERFEDIRVGAPLLYDVADCQKVVEILAARHADAAGQPGDHVVLVGHGTYTPATATYSQLDYMFTTQGHPHIHVATIEGYPTFDTMLARLQADKARKVTLVPLLFVAGDHASNDIAVDWKEALEARGLQVDAHLEGIGEIPAIQDIYIEHIRYSLRHVPVDIMKKKAAYAAGESND